MRTECADRRTDKAERWVHKLAHKPKAQYDFEAYIKHVTTNSFILRSRPIFYIFLTNNLNINVSMSLIIPSADPTS
jgi:hypothetical protein